jgi:lysophospholipase L1-like esterase
MTSSSDLRVISVVSQVSFGLSAVVCFVWGWQFAPGIAGLGLFVYMVAMLGVHLSTTRPHLTPRWPRWLMSLAIVNGLLVVPELVLRAVGYDYTSKVEFGYPRGQELRAFVADEKLFWKFESQGSDGINSLGFVDDDVPIPKPRERYRVLFFGDSCTWQGYPNIAEAIANKHQESGPHVESVVLAAPGYSSHQGVVLAESYGPRLEADLVFVYYGWNDHWQAYGAIDRSKVIEVAPRSSGLGILLQELRLFQAAQAMGVRLRGASIEPLSEVRVPEPDYRENLLRLHTVFAKRGVPVVFITAPTSHWSLGVPDYLISEGFVPNEDFALQKHARYNRIVRDVAKHVGAELLDLDEQISASKRVDELMLADGIHFTTTGTALVGSYVADVIEAHRGSAATLSSSTLSESETVR